MGLLTALAVAGSALAGFLGTVADTGVQVFHVVIDILRGIFDWSIIAVKELLDFERSQPITFTLIVGTLLILFVLSPIVFGVNWNHAIFGRIETHQESIAPAPTILENLSTADYLEAVNSTKLVKANPSLTVKPVFMGEKTRMFLGSRTLFSKIFPFTSSIVADKIAYAMSADEASVRFQEKRYELCGSLIAETAGGTIPDDVIWEAKLDPVDHELIERLKISTINPSMRDLNITVSCFEMDVDQSTEADIPGSDWVEKVGNLSLFIANGSICPDYPMEYLSPVVLGTPSQNPFSGIPLVGSFVQLVGYLLNGVRGFLFDVNATGQREDCYLMFNEDTRERVYLETPSWISDNGESANFTAYVLYGKVILNQPTIPAEHIAVLNSIQLPVSTAYYPGVASVLTAPYDLLEETSGTVTGGATNPYFSMFSELVTGLILILLGIVGVLMVVNLQHLGKK